MSVPTEILGISKLYSISSKSNSERYNRIVKTLQELKILDVTHVVSRGLEEDPSGSWSSLKKATDDDLTAAKKFVEDLNTFLTSLERLIDSLDVSTPKGGFNEKFIDFLSGKTADGLTSPAARDSSISGVALRGNTPSDGLTNVDLISLLLHEIRIRSTGVEDFNSSNGRAAFEVLRWLGQTEPYDYNGPGTNRSPKNYISRYASEYSVNPLELCVHALSSTFNLSAGITRLKRIQSEVGLSVSNISDADKVFDGVRVADIEKYATFVSNVLYQRSLDTGRLESTSYALKVARYDDSLNKIAPCEKPINITPETRYTSGETSLIRDSLAENDFNFQKLGLYDAQLESSLDQLQKVTESLVGFMDTENELTPFAVFSKILKSSIAALDLAGKDDLNKYQLLALMRLASISGDQSVEIEKFIVRSVGVLKYYRISKGTGSKAGSESSKSTVTLATSRTSTGSDSIQADAEVKTVETVSSTSDAADSGRVITRAAGDSNLSADIISSVVNSISNKRTAESARELEKLLAAKNAADRAREYAEAQAEDTGKLDYVQQYRDGQRITDAKRVQDDAEAAYLEELQNVNAASVSDETEQEIFNALEESRKKEGTIFSLMVDLYDDFTTKSKNSVGENEKITDSMGYTSYGKMDEYAILSLIISCFSQIFDLVMPSDTGFVGTDFNFGAAELSAAMNTIQAAMTTGGTGLSTQIDYRLYGVRKYVETYQNCYAFLDAYLKNIRESRLLAISNFSEVSKDLSFTSDVGRLKSLANVTSHSVAVRRALLRKWEPVESSGYLSRFSSTVVPVDSYISTLRSSKVPNTYADNSLQNMRVLHVGVPASTIVSDSIGKTQLINVVVGKLDYRYYLSDTFIEKSFIFDPALFVGDLGIAATGVSSRSGSTTTTFYFFDRNGSSGPYSYDETLARYLEVNPGADRNVLESVILNCYNSAMIEAYQYYTSGIVLDESTSTGVDTSISPAGLSALGLLSGLNLSDVSLPPGAAISSAFSDGHINFEEAASGLSSSKKEILSNVASSYLFKSNRILDRIARNFDHDRVFLIPVDPDSFEINASREFIDTFGSQNLRFTGSARGQLLDQDPSDNGMMAGSFYAQISEYTITTANITESSASAPSGFGFEIDTLAERAARARASELLGDSPDPRKSSVERAVDRGAGYAANATRRTRKSPPGGSITSDDAKKAPATMKKFNPKKRG